MNSLLEMASNLNPISSSSSSLENLESIDPIPCRLPNQELICNEEYEEDQDEEQHSFESCFFCSHRSSNSENGINKIQKLIENDEGNLPEKELYEKASINFNHTCVNYDMLLPPEKKSHLSSIKRGHVRRHFRSIEHLANGELTLINRKIRYLIDCMDQIEKDQLWKKTSDSNLFINENGLKHYKEISVLLTNLIILRHKCKQNKKISSSSLIQQKSKIDSYRQLF